MKFKLTTVSGLILLSCTSLQAAIVANFANAPVVVEKAPSNGGTIVQINHANRDGVSINSYSSFNVGPQGVLLSNNTSNARSTQGFNIEANTRLGYNTAKVIINEVFSTQATDLNGPIEIVGDQADLLVVNPRGITCNGCGFINAQNSTLSTAQYLLGRNGDISFRVDSQLPITINKKGLIDRTSNNVNLISNAIMLYGKVSVANNLNVIAGRNQISSDLKNVRSITNGLLPDVFVFSSGGMYANNINIISTRNDDNAFFNEGELTALNDINITTDGYINNGTRSISNAKISARHGNANITLNQDGRLINSAIIEGNRNVNIQTNRGSITNDNRGTIKQTGNSDGTLTLITEMLNNNTADTKIESNGSISIQSNSLINKGKIGALHNLDLIAKNSQNIYPALYYSKIENSRTGQLNGRVIRLLKFALLKNDGKISATDALALRGNTVNNLAYGSMFARNNFDIIAQTRFSSMGKIEIGIKGITPYHRIIGTGNSLIRNLFYDTNRPSYGYVRRFDVAGNPLPYLSSPPRRPLPIRW